MQLNLSHFGLIGLIYQAAMTVVVVFINISPHVGPKTSLPHQVCGPFDSLVTMVVVEMFEHFALKTFREEELKKLLHLFLVA